MKTITTILAIAFSLSCFSQEPDTMVYYIVDTMPGFTYKHGKDIKESVELYTLDSLRWPSQDDCAGNIILRFIVEIDGDISDIEIMRGFDYCRGFNEEAVRLVQSMPPWSPAVLNEREVRAYVIMPVRFRISGY